MAWTWRYEGRDGEALDDLTALDGGLAGASFSTRSDAESWLGENWRALRAAGVARVRLLDGTARVGRPLPLEVPDRRAR
jgi:hypothetical protein